MAELTPQQRCLADSYYHETCSWEPDAPAGPATRWLREQGFTHQEIIRLLDDRRRELQGQEPPVWSRLEFPAITGNLPMKENRCSPTPRHTSTFDPWLLTPVAVFLGALLSDYIEHDDPPLTPVPEIMAADAESRGVIDRFGMRIDGRPNRFGFSVRYEHDPPDNLWWDWVGDPHDLKVKARLLTEEELAEEKQAYEEKYAYGSDKRYDDPTPGMERRGTKLLTGEQETDEKPEDDAAEDLPGYERSWRDVPRDFGE